MSQIRDHCEPHPTGSITGSINRRDITFTGEAGTITGDVWAANDDTPTRTMLLLHGGGQTRHSWRRAALGFAHQGWSVVTVDARGHGASDWDPTADYETAAMARDVHCIVRQMPEIDEVSPVPPVIIGASMGAISALVAEAQFAPLASALVLVDVAPRLQMSGVDRIRDFIGGNLAGFADLTEVAEAVSAYQPGGGRRNPERLRTSLRTGSDGRLYWHWDPAFADVMRTMDIDHRHRLLTEAAQNVSIPTLLVRGGRSDVVTPAAAQEFAALFTNASVVDIPGASHMLTGDDNSAFLNRANAFLNAL